MIDRDVLWVATPSLRPFWIGRTKPINASEIWFLRLIVLEGTLSWKVAFQNMGESKASTAINSLQKAGAIRRIRYGLYEITEKGRIAIALVNARAKP